MSIETGLLQPGRLVTLRGRDWMVLPSEDRDVLIVRPLGGSDDETVGIYLPLKIESEMPKEATFPLPGVEDLGDITKARLLYDAARLGFRNASGPFRSFGKLAFRPRAYQVVPLVMALKQEVVRLLIADDVGVGKTIEALLVVREMLERGKAKRFAVVCPPHLCDQWGEEIKAKLGLEATTLRTSMKARLEYDIPGDTSIYEHYPYQIISIDFIKSDARRNVFVAQCPELLIVDEAHACTRPAGASDSQQQRYHLLKQISNKPKQHVVLLTATPHSGKSEEFQSLLGLLREEFDDESWISGDPNKSKILSRHVVQRKRKDVEMWMDEDTKFPLRDSIEMTYSLSKNYEKLFSDILEFAKLLVAVPEGRPQQSARSWAALGLLRGVMSSPRAGKTMLDTRLEKLSRCSHESGEEIELILGSENPSPVGDPDDHFSDITPTQVFEKIDWTTAQKQKIQEFRKRIEKLEGVVEDQKANVAADVLSEWLSRGFNPVVFCRYINTAKYVLDILSQRLTARHADLDMRVVTSEEPDERRREIISELGKSRLRLLVATDCLSEGINLQEQFDAVFHYDLPWNPNRLEQREGRVDRFGQESPIVKVCLFYGKENPIDGIVLEVLVRKIREIKETTGVSIPFPADSQSIIDAITVTMLLEPSRKPRRFDVVQDSLFDVLDYGEAREARRKLAHKIDEAFQHEAQIRSRFNQDELRSSEIEEDLRAVDEAIGTPKDTESFVVEVLQNVYGVQVIPEERGYSVVPAGNRDITYTLPGNGDRRKICFISPTPAGYHYIGRNHQFVERLCQMILVNTVERLKPNAARATVIRTDAVSKKTTIGMFRCRNLIEHTKRWNQVIAEEMILHGWVGGPNVIELDHRASMRLLVNARPTDIMNHEEMKSFFENEINQIARKKEEINRIAKRQSQAFAEAHTRFSKLTNQDSYQVVQPVLPPDLVGLYVMLPRRPR